VCVCRDEMKSIGMARRSVCVSVNEMKSTKVFGPNDMRGLMLSDDLLFISRVQGAARDHSLTCASVRTPEQLLEKVAVDRPRCVLLDLHLLPDLESVVAQLKNLNPPPFLVGYGSHVDAVTLHQARVAGCDVVMPRSQFVEELPTCLPQWFGSA
jgi:hypothetical protein